MGVRGMVSSMGLNPREITKHYLDSMAIPQEKRRLYPFIMNAIAKYWDSLEDVDISVVLSEIIDSIDPSLDVKENIAIINQVVRKYAKVEQLAQEVEEYEDTSEDDVLSEIQSGLRELAETIEKIKARVREIRRERDRLVKELSGLVYQHGWVEYKWVKNKVGNRYYYYYLRFREGKTKRSVYLGKQIPPRIMELMRNKERARAIYKRLKELDKEERELLKRIDRAIYSLWGI